MENEQKEIAKEIRNEYVARERTELDELKALDKKVKVPAEVLGYSLGSAGALVLGTGMCLAMKVIGTGVMSAAALMASGVVIGCVGIAVCVANYFIYKAVLNARKKKYGNRIIELSNKLLNEQ